MTPEKMAELKDLQQKKDELYKEFLAARDRWTKACSDMNYALLRETDYWNFIRYRGPEPDWLYELAPDKSKKKEVMQSDSALRIKTKLAQMEKQMLDIEKGGEDGSNRKSTQKPLRLW